MARAGQAGFAALRHHWPNASRIVVLVGQGNNGGDGYVLARLAWQQQWDVHIVTVGVTRQLPDDAENAAQAARAEGIPETSWQGLLPEADVYVDALLGIGLSREPDGEFAEVIAALNASAVPVLALDIPSGLNADTGTSYAAGTGHAVRADVTCTFLVDKIGLWTGEGPVYAGHVRVESLELPSALLSQFPAPVTRLSHRLLRTSCTPRALNSHKGTHGHVLIIGGDHGMGGAAILAAEAALRAGAGKVSVATRASHISAFNSRCPEVMAHAVENSADLAPLLAQASVIAIGPGLGQAAWGQSLWAAVKHHPLPLVVDADALNLLAQEPFRREHWVLSPHPGEAARLLSDTVNQVESDRLAALTALHHRYQARIVLKGVGSLIYEEGHASLCPFGNPGMASGGMGDVLTGIIAALWAQALPSPVASAVLAHALAGDAAAKAGERGLLAHDIIAHLRAQVNPL